MPFELPALPYPKDALAPHMSAETLDFHHGKHHNTYITKLNAAVATGPFAGLSLEECIKKASAEGNKAVFNNAAQHFNHSFFWNCLAPTGGGAPSGALGDAIVATFGSYEAFKTAFANESVNHFASGWGWLVKDASGALKITSTHDADTPMVHGHTPILTLDVWEHAYYIDHRNSRPNFVEAFWKLVNWDFAAKNFAG
jgi:superoxide dismutase, Fe-Mn family